MKREEVLKSYDKLRRSFETLREAVLTAETTLEIDGTLQRFEYTFETFWKFLRILLEYHGFECRSPRSCIKTAFRVGFSEKRNYF
ncbi:MAG: nucleotidyltransferase substrate binding protein [Aquificaceae bacterium]